MNVRIIFDEKSKNFMILLMWTLADKKGPVR